jgi:hypothetical protein
MAGMKHIARACALAMACLLSGAALADRVWLPGQYLPAFGGPVVQSGATLTDGRVQYVKWQSTVQNYTPTGFMLTLTAPPPSGTKISYAVYGQTADGFPGNRVGPAYEYTTTINDTGRLVLPMASFGTTIGGLSAPYYWLAVTTSKTIFVRGVASALPLLQSNGLYVFAHITDSGRYISNDDLHEFQPEMWWAPMAYAKLPSVAPLTSFGQDQTTADFALVR